MTHLIVIQGTSRQVRGALRRNLPKSVWRVLRHHLGRPFFAVVDDYEVTWLGRSAVIRYY
jgi:hypothetical protein